MRRSIGIAFILFWPAWVNAADSTIPTDTESVLTHPAILGTLALAIIVLIVFGLIMIFRIQGLTGILFKKQKEEGAQWVEKHIINLEGEQIDRLLEERKKALHYSTTGRELGGEDLAEDTKGLVHYMDTEDAVPLVHEKKNLKWKGSGDVALNKLVIAYLTGAIVWLVIGTTVGQYLGMKFVWPEMDSIEWLSFGRLRPVHTNTVFWGWASLAMIGLGYYVVARTSNTSIYKTSWGWLSFWLINLSVTLGNACLMMGINNGGGEYREYIWPVAALFAIGLAITFLNYYRTIANRKTKEIYISNWFIMASCIWTLVLVIIAYLPGYQSGLGETIIQGYYMHQGVGMWFMTFTLGLVYYFLPSALNKPIYSYALGILAFWTQMLFYTMIGTHHFIFSPLPWWLQTVAIVFSMGMFIPVIAGSTNFLLTLKGSWNSIRDSYVVPFLLVGVIFYFVGSSQGSFQAFRFTNYAWHFTDFNVAHSHMTMYGIISFFLWGSIYYLVPQLTGVYPNQVKVGIHFWFAFLGLMAYMFSLMIGGTIKGIYWIQERPFIESVVMMMPYWVWRAVGGTLMLLSHFMFAHNFYTMVKKTGIRKILKQAN